jgi:hypothetical protein
VRQGERQAEGDSATIGAGELTGCRRAREGIEDREDRAAVGGLGEPLQDGVEREDQIATADFQSVT